MLRGLYTSAAGMIAQQRRHDTVTNNISNLNTPGFKQGNAVNRSFPEMLIALTNGQANHPGSLNIGLLNTGVFAEEDLSVYVQGDLQQTRQPFDLALRSHINVPGQAFDGAGKGIDEQGNIVYQPQAFFTIAGADDSARYTRNGNFTVSTAGQLVTEDGYSVVGVNGQPITLFDDVDNVAFPDAIITETGVLLDPRTGQAIRDADGNAKQLLLTRIDQPNRLIREGTGLFRLNEDEADLAQPVAAEDDVTLYQGYLERSNVDPAQALVDMMTALRAYEANQKMVQYYDRSLEKAVNEVGRIG
ncbi:flagellar hook-basal body protein [Paenibacillus senegalensis]|uniref:flagellar hook-basal body protein n=1 Tax=Paenibacillus senegalensis TaxID=1465766 RepID=UPI000287A3B7|nr:flagellar hook-basal body protein [Paenibacillus senegalensis]